jgi:hypothetical protein
LLHLTEENFPSFHFWFKLALHVFVKDAWFVLFLLVSTPILENQKNIYNCQSFANFYENITSL